MVMTCPAALGFTSDRTSPIRIALQIRTPPQAKNTVRLSQVFMGKLQYSDSDLSTSGEDSFDQSMSRNAMHNIRFLETSPKIPNSTDILYKHYLL